MSIGYLPGAHVERCPVYRSILKQRPAWSYEKSVSGKKKRER
jgi:DNA-3-methyladenine glycosylase I